MLKGRLGLETARVPHKDRHGLMWLQRGRLFVDGGTLRFAKRTTAPGDDRDAVFDIPFQMVTAILLQPGTTVTHDALRLCARHGTGVLAVGQDGVRLYASMPFGPDDSRLARAQVAAWADPDSRLRVARHIYGFKLDEVFPDSPIHVLRGIEGARAKQTYKLFAQRYAVPWRGRRYDRSKPEGDDAINTAINHASVATLAAAQVAVAAVGAIPQLGFIHEDSGLAFCLDIADSYRDEVTLTAAFGAVQQVQKQGGNLERVVRKNAGRLIRQQRVVPSMIERVKSVLSA
jgi:CRISPR-associated protein Cas1